MLYLCRRLYIFTIAIFLIHDAESKAVSYSCTVSKYRSNDGLCNNLQHPEWGSSNSSYARLVPPADGNLCLFYLIWAILKANFVLIYIVYCATDWQWFQEILKISILAKIIWKMWNVKIFTSPWYILQKFLFEMEY